MAVLAPIALEQNRSASCPTTPAPNVRGITCSRLMSHSLHRQLTQGRCHRLNKECQSSPAVRKRRIIKNIPSSKTARLEEKLDGLVSLLQSAAHLLPVGTSDTAAAAQVQLSLESLESPHSDPGGDRRHNSEAIHIPSQGMYCPRDDLGLHPPISTMAISVAYIPRDFEPSRVEVDENLKTFLSCQLKHLPFIILPESAGAQELRQERPFLWFCIMTVSSKSSVQQAALGREIRIILGHQVLLEGERTLDLLLGLLTYIVWYAIPAALSREYLPLLK
jgi:hypothetical protein